MSPYSAQGDAVLKPRYYPHITAITALILTAAPVCLLFVFRPDRNLVEQEVSEQLALTEATINASADPPELPSTELPSAEMPAAEMPAAELPAAGPASSGAPRLARAIPNLSDVITDTAEPVNRSPDLTSPPHRTSGVPAIEIQPGTSAPLVSPGDTSIPASDAAPQWPAEAVAAPDHKSATGHPFFGQHQPMESSASSAVANVAEESRATRDAEAESSRPARESAAAKRRRSRKDDVRAGVPPQTAAMTGADSPDGSGLPSAADSAPLVEDVLLHAPLVDRPVQRVEHVLAVTQAKGWPVALIRSDIPGDEWWVQQMVGIQGNTFTARVNFGNESSLSGSSYIMIFVFLDSADEVRRFRIAKQFRELPEGVRRSREFRFVRN